MNAAIRVDVDDDDEDNDDDGNDVRQDKAGYATKAVVLPTICNNKSIDGLRIMMQSINIKSNAGVRTLEMY